MTMSEDNFKKLYAHSQVFVAESQQELVRAGDVSDIVLVLEGEAEMLLPDGRTTSVGPHSLLGTISFVSGATAAATILAVPGSKYILWRREELKKLLASEPAIAKCLDLRIGEELMHKLS